MNIQCKTNPLFSQHTNFCDRVLNVLNQYAFSDFEFQTIRASAMTSDRGQCFLDKTGLMELMSTDIDCQRQALQDRITRPKS